MNRQYSLKKNHDIEKLVRGKVSVGNKYFAIYYRKNNETKIAFSVSKKNGDAVIRNYQKRVVKEIIRELFEYVENYKMLIVVKKTNEELSFLEKRENLKRLLLKIRKDDKYEK